MQTKPNGLKKYLGYVRSGNISISTVSVSGVLDKKLQSIAEVGFDAVESFESDFISFDGSAIDVAKLGDGTS